MRKAAGKRLPHGATSNLLLAVLWQIHLHRGRPEPVSRADLVRAARLPETTVDDRLRVLVKRRKVMKLGRGLYTPIRQKDGEIFDGYWPRRPPAGWLPSPQKELEKAGLEPKPPGTRRVLHFPEGVVLDEQWISVADYIRIESRRQQLKDFGTIDLDDEDKV